MSEPLPYLADAARQLESAARRLRRIASGEDFQGFIRNRLISEAYANIDAALARMPDRPEVAK